MWGSSINLVLIFHFYPCKHLVTWTFRWEWKEFCYNNVSLTNVSLLLSYLTKIVTTNNSIRTFFDTVEGKKIESNSLANEFVTKQLELFTFLPSTSISPTIPLYNAHGFYMAEQSTIVWLWTLFSHSVGEKWLLWEMGEGTRGDLRLVRQVVRFRKEYMEFE